MTSSAPSTGSAAASSTIRKRPDQIRAVVDADSIVFAACSKHEAAAEGEIGPDVQEGIVYSLRKRIHEIMELCEATDVVCCLGEGRNWRHDIYPYYKGNRRGQVRPEYLHWARASALPGMFRTVLVPGMEADDLAATLVTEPQDCRSVLCSLDKDMAQVPGEHCRIHPDGTLSLIQVSRREARLNLLRQWLTGDAADNIKGAYRVGPKKANQWLKDNLDDSEDPLSPYVLAEALNFVVSTGVEEELALDELNCVTLLTFGEWDWLQGRPYRMWQVTERADSPKKVEWSLVPTIWRP